MMLTRLPGAVQLKHLPRTNQYVERSSSYNWRRESRRLRTLLDLLQDGYKVRAAVCNEAKTSFYSVRDEGKAKSLLNLSNTCR